LFASICVASSKLMSLLQSARLIELQSQLDESTIEVFTLVFMYSKTSL